MLRVLDNSSPATIPPPRTYLTSDQPVRFGDGFFAEEREGQRLYRWMDIEGELLFEPRDEATFLELSIFCEFWDLSQDVSLLVGETGTKPDALMHGWRPLSLPVSAGASSVRLRCNKLFPPSYYAGDSRKLSIRVSVDRHHTDAARHRFMRLQHENAVLNTREMIDGATHLESTPVALGIDLHGVCNIKPPCVYCDWDFSKDLEGDHVDDPFTLETLQEWGEFFDNSSSLINCSIGEPFMMRHLDELLDTFGDTGKALEVTTNGQVLTDKNVKKLVGRNIDLYISLDAATPETFAKLRNEKFEIILENLRRLIQAKGGRGGYPRVNLVFMPMKVNVHELEPFIRLCADLEADRAILRPLNYLEHSSLDWERSGHHFIYNEQLLDFSQLIHASGRAAELAKRLGLTLSDQLDFGGDMEEMFHDEFTEGRGELTDDSNGNPAIAATEVEKPGAATEATPSSELAEADVVTAAEETAEIAETADSTEGAALPPLGEDRLPACLEPWKSLYILRRGIQPCCYGHAPIADMDEYRETWNGNLMRDIRKELLGGRFHEYCTMSTACPIVRKSGYSDDPVLRPSWLQRNKHWLKQVDRLFLGMGRRFYRMRKPRPVHIRRSSTD